MTYKRTDLVSQAQVSGPGLFQAHRKVFRALSGVSDIPLRTALLAGPAIPLALSAMQIWLQSALLGFLQRRWQIGTTHLD
jgi:hypothetical protein